MSRTNFQIEQERCVCLSVCVCVGVCGDRDANVAAFVNLIKLGKVYVGVLCTILATLPINLKVF